MTEFVVTQRTDGHLETLETEYRNRLIQKIDEATEFTEHRLNKLSGSPYYSVRAGDYRAIVDWDRENDVIRVLAAGHRRNVYDRYL